MRTWTVTRFRGMISTQPGSTPLSSFKILSLDDVDGHGGCSAGTEIGNVNQTPNLLIKIRINILIIKIFVMKDFKNKFHEDGWLI